MVSFSFLQFSSDEVETIFWESEENIKSCLNQNLIIRTLLENFLKLKTSLRQSFLKPILWAFENRIFFSFLQIFDWRSCNHFQGHWGKLLKPRFSLRKPFRKWFWGYLGLKNECFERLKRAFFSFFKFLCDEVETIFWES